MWSNFRVILCVSVLALFFSRDGVWRCLDVVGGGEGKLNSAAGPLCLVV